MTAEQFPGDDADASRLYDAYLDAALAGRAEDPASYLRAHGHPADASLLQNLEVVRQLVAKDRFDHDAPVDVAKMPFDRLGDYRPIRYLGGGGMGLVFVAEQESLGRLVALKVIRDKYRASGEVKVRFVREAKAVARLRHPNVVTVYGFGEDHGVLYLAMELVPGSTLRELILAGNIPTAKILHWGVQIAGALQTAHEAQILHRDVKPTNIIISDSGEAVLLDFGLARLTDGDWATLTGTFVGTPAYASPEQLAANKDEPVDARSDVYSLGVSLYEALTGALPFGNLSAGLMADKILQGDPVALREANPAISSELELVVLKAIAREPDARYQTAAELASDLEALLDHRQTQAQTRSATRQSPGPASGLNSTLAGVRLESLIGRGAQGKVYRGTHLALDAPRAVKIMDGWMIDSQEVAGRFEREARLAAQIDHPNVVRVHDVGRQDNCLYLVMELIEGQDLKQLIDGQGPLPWARAVKLISAIGSGLDKAHQLDVVHRDIKPSNMVLDRQTDRVVLTDFGMAKDTVNDQTLTATGALLGTPATMAPEVCSGERAIPASDQYSLACSLFFLMTGCFPFEGGSALALIQQHINQQPPDLSRLVPDCPAPITRAVHQALSKDPALRYPSVDRFIRALRVRPVMRLPEEVDWNHPLIKMAGVVLLLVFGFFGWQIFSGQETEPETEATTPKTRRPHPTQQAKTAPARKKTPPVKKAPPTGAELSKFFAAKLEKLPGTNRWRFDYDFSDGANRPQMKDWSGFRVRVKWVKTGFRLRMTPESEEDWGFWRHKARFTDVKMTVWLTCTHETGGGEFHLFYAGDKDEWFPQYRGEFLPWGQGGEKPRTIVFFRKKHFDDNSRELGRQPGKMLEPDKRIQVSLERKGDLINFRVPGTRDYEARDSLQKIRSGFLGFTHERDWLKNNIYHRILIEGTLDPNWKPR